MPTDLTDVDALISTAQADHQAGRLSQARAIYERVVQSGAQRFDAYHGLALIHAHHGELAQALALFQQAIHVNPSQAAAWCNLGHAQQQLKQSDAALHSYQQALRIKPDYALVHARRAALLHQLQRFSEALQGYEALLQIKPDNIAALNDQGNVLMQLKHWERAEQSFAALLRLDPQHTQASNNRGLALHELQRLDEALACYEATLRQDPNNVLAHINRGAVLHKLQRLDQAQQSYEAALRIRPHSASALHHLGLLLYERQQPHEALEKYDAALRLEPTNAQTWINRSLVLQRLQRLDEALGSSDTAVRIDAHNATAWFNRGTVLHEMQRLDEALASYETAQRINPDHVDAQWNGAQVLLLQGRYPQGWQQYQARFKKEGVGQNYDRGFAQPLWSGQQPLQGKTVFVYWEQGLGDTLQFVRYLGVLHERGAQVVFEAQTPLLRLLHSLPMPITLVERGQPLPAFDYHCPLISLPLALATTLASIPAQVPYLWADAAQVGAWRSKLGPTTQPRVGLVWSGTGLGKNNYSRSVLLADLVALLDLPYEWHSLQKDYRECDLPVLAQHPQVQQHQDDLHDFSDTAALIACMDWVIAIDTSVAHLAGALGKPVWVLLKWTPDFRWLLDRTDSPWYPSAQLFRQDPSRQWPPVLARVRQALQAVATRQDQPVGPLHVGPLHLQI